MTNPLITEWSERIKHANQKKIPLRLIGSDSKAFYGHPCEGEVFELNANTGIISYDPSELVITLNGGTSLLELEQVLTEKNQFLPFEPPHFGPQATIAGCIASGLAGPRRASAGGTQDFVLGAHLLDGHGELLRFGGQVMKNVAGYDVSRLLAGSLGSLGVITQLSLKVLPIPDKEITVCLDLDQAKTLQTINRLNSLPLPISASTWYNHRLYIRLSGASDPIESAIKTIGGQLMEATESQLLWSSIREQTHAFFTPKENKTLWRLSVPSVAQPLLEDHEQLIEWGGSLRWLHSDLNENDLRAQVEQVGGTATAFRSHQNINSVFHPLDPVLLTIQKRLKSKFDPAGIFNPGRLYKGEL